MTWDKGEDAEDEYVRRTLDDAMKVVEWSVVEFENKPPQVTATAIAILLGGWLARYSPPVNWEENIQRIALAAKVHGEKIRNG